MVKTGIADLPNGPRIPLDNYLLDLLDENYRKGRSLYLNGVENLFADVWSEIIEENWRGLNVRKLIPERFGVTTGVFYAYKNGRKGIPIERMYQLVLLWEEVCNKSDLEVNEKWGEIFNSNLTFSTHSKHQKTKLPRHITPKLSYLIGWMCGDGHLKEMHNYLIKISEKSTDQLELVLKPLFKELFNVDTPIFQRYKGGYALQIGSKPIFRFMKNVLKIKVGKIPRLIEEMDEINKEYFLRGVFDSEGCVILTRPRLIIAQAKIDFLKEIQRLLAELGISTNGPTRHETERGVWYTIRVDNKLDFKRFANLIGSSHVEKSEKIEAWRNKLEKGRSS